VRSDPFGLGLCVAENSRRPRMSDFSLERRECLVDGRANNRVIEPQQWLRTQDVDACERARCFGGSLHVQVGERGRLAWIGVVAQDRDRLCKPP
jgi:hypothetical protein